MKKITLLLVTVMLVLCQNVSADDSIFVGVLTHHINHRDELNEQNQLIGIKYNNFFGTTFVNSNYDRTWFFGYCFNTEKKFIYKELYAKVNLYAGISTGYDVEFNVNGWYPALSPTLEIGGERVALETLYWPSDGGVICCMVDIKF